MSVIEPFNGMLHVEPVEPDASSGGIIRIPSATDDHAVGRVVRTGRGQFSESGENDMPDLDGAEVVYLKRSAHRVDVNGSKFTLIPLSSVLCRIGP